MSTSADTAVGEREDAEPPVSRPRSRWAVGTTVVGLLVLVAELATTVGVLAHYARHQWFFFDEWRFTVIERLDHNTLSTLFLSHNGHWVTLPLLEYRALFTVFGMKSYAPYIAGTIIVHVVICILLFQLTRRGGAGALEAALLVGVVAFAGVGVENLLWAFQTTFTGALAFGLAALLVATGGRLSRRRGLAVGALTLGALMCSAIGLPMLVAVAVATTLLGGWRGALRSLWLPVISYVAWYLIFGPHGQTQLAPHSYFHEIPRFIRLGLTAAVGGLTGVQHATLVVCVLAVLVVLVDRFHRAGSPDRHGRVVAVACLFALAVQLVLTALTRVQYGDNVAESSRYCYVIVVLLFLSFARLVRRLVQLAARGGPFLAVPAALVAVVALVVGYDAVGHQGLDHVKAFAERRVQLQETAKPEMLGAVTLINEKARFVNTVVDPDYAPIPIPDLRRAAHRFDPPPASRNVQGVLNARSMMQVVVTTDDRLRNLLPAPDGLSGYGLDGTPPAAGTCSEVRARADQSNLTMFVGPDGGEIRVRLNSGKAGVIGYLYEGGRRSRPHRWPLPVGRTSYVASTAAGDRVLLQLNAGQRLTVCR